MWKPEQHEITYARLTAAKDSLDRAFDAYERAARAWMDAVRECDRVDGLAQADHALAAIEKLQEDNAAMLAALKLALPWLESAKPDTTPMMHEAYEAVRTAIAKAEAAE